MSAPWLAPSQFTLAGGLLFLVPVLEHCGYAEWLHPQPVWRGRDIARRLFALLLHRLAIPLEDPVWQLATPVPPAFPAWLAPPLPSAGVDAVELAAAPQGDEHLPRAWLAACRRWSRSRGPLGLYDLVKRPAFLCVTPTHLDVLFHLGQADPVVRRLGLDIDPGWVAWFGRIVAFHYSDRLPAFPYPFARGTRHDC